MKCTTTERDIHRDPKGRRSICNYLPLLGSPQTTGVFLSLSFKEAVEAGNR